MTPVHFSETCDEDVPQLITHVETTRAGINGEQALPAIHAGLEGSDLLPDQHLVDAGYVDAAHLLQSHHHYGVDLTASCSSQLTSGKLTRTTTSRISPLIGKHKP